ncbi:MAG: hypothetical protein QW478_00890 [Candidatus Micrarchaeaceae archaeon]
MSKKKEIVYYHFSNRPSMQYDYKNISPQDSLIYKLNLIYQQSMPKAPRDFLVDRIKNEISVEYKNLTLLAIANYIVYILQSEDKILTPELFDSYFSSFSNMLMPDLTDKDQNEIKRIRVNFKISLLRYVYYVLQSVDQVEKYIKF